MNQLIRLLAEQAGAEFYADTILVNGKGADDLMRKFAELIVRECAQLVQGVPTDTMGYRTADQKIKEHFGVE